MNVAAVKSLHLAVHSTSLSDQHVVVRVGKCLKLLINRILCLF